MFASASVCLFLAAAAPPLDRLPADRAGEIVRRAIAYAGGWSAYENARTIQFKKTTIRYLPDGREESRRVQLHRYRLHPGMSARIEWEEGGQRIVLANDGRNAWKWVDGKVATAQDDVNQARNNTFGSHYVFHMPFKLTDVGVHVAYAERRRLPDGTQADGLRVTYDKGAGDAGGMHDWTYYFDVKTGRLAANHLKYAAAGFDYTEYLDDKPVGEMRLSTRRYGYGADARGRKGPRTSEIVYEEIRVNEPMDESLFAPPR